MAKVFFARVKRLKKAKKKVERKKETKKWLPGRKRWIKSKGETSTKIREGAIEL